MLEGSLAGADQAMVNAFTGGFRVAQTRLAIDKALPDPAAAAAALESAQIVALAILVREQLDQAQFEVVYRPFATILPGPGYQPAPPVDRQIVAFLRALPTFTGPPEAEIAAVARALSEPPRAVAPAGGLAAVGVGPATLNPAANYAATWKEVIATANQSGRTHSFRAMQDSAEQAAPHDGLGIVGFAGVAAGGIFMRDILPIEKVLLLYEPFAAALPYESLQ
ncbi:MAG: hypothetical protein ACREOY_14770 [Candidatus Dormibacteraceae bacterium]